MEERQSSGEIVGKHTDGGSKAVDTLVGVSQDILHDVAAGVRCIARAFSYEEVKTWRRQRQIVRRWLV